MKNSLLTLLISFASTNILGDVSHFKCEAKDSYIKDQKGYHPLPYKKGEHFESLIINRQTKLVSWKARTFDFVEDFNKDSIYEIRESSDLLSINIRFNAVTGMLDEDTYSYSSPGKLRLTTYLKFECKKTTPIFE